MAIKVTQALIYQELQTIKETIEKHTEVDNGNFRELRQILEGSESAPGMKIRLDRIEQREEGRMRHFGYIWTVITIIFTGVLTLFTNQCTLPITTNTVPSIANSMPIAGSTSTTEAK